jgi:hypothetical protein
MQQLAPLSREQAVQVLLQEPTAILTAPGCLSDPIADSATRKR